MRDAYLQIALAEPERVKLIDTQWSSRAHAGARQGRSSFPILKAADISLPLPFAMNYVRNERKWIMFDQLTGNARVKAVLKRMLIRTGCRAHAVHGRRRHRQETLRARSRARVELPHAEGPRGVRRMFVLHAHRETQLSRNATMRTNGRRSSGRTILDVGLVVAPKRVLRVEQMRQIEKEANFRPFEGKARVFLIDEADKLNDASANALLKVLEEPPRTSHLILITARPAMLLPTILSRCQMIRFSPLTPDEIETHLTKNKLVDNKTARLRARAAGGSMGRALSGDLVTFTSQRKAMLKVLNALVLSDDRAELLRSAEQLNEAQYKEEFEERLDVLETLIRDAWMLSLGVKPSQLVNEDLSTRA